VRMLLATAPAAKATPLELSDAQLDGVSGGQGSGGRLLSEIVQNSEPPVGQFISLINPIAPGFLGESVSDLNTSDL
jgi:hypothetical protein